MRCYDEAWMCFRDHFGLHIGHMHYTKKSCSSAIICDYEIIKSNVLDQQI